MNEVGLILEGGGMRGAFTAGVLDYWMARGLALNDVYGVSAGACLACSYLCGQPGRGLRVWTDYLDDPRFCSLRSLLTTGDLFGAELNYDLVPRVYDPLDNAAFLAKDANFFAVVTNARTGRAEYMRIGDMLKDVQVVRASASLPLVSRLVPLGSGKYLDGGVADSIPIRRSIADGHRKNVLVLTRTRDYRKTPNRALWLIRLRYARYPRLVEAAARRHEVYNETLDFIEAQERAGTAFVIRPDVPPEIGRVEKDASRIRKLYDVGYAAAQREYDRLMAFLAAPETNLQPKE